MSRDMLETKSDLIDAAIGRFTSDDPLRPGLHHINLDTERNRVYASDAHIAVEAPPSVLTVPATSHDDFPDVAGLYEKNWQEQTIARLSFEDIASVVYAVSSEDQPCAECHGSGWKECPCCNNESECEDCGGSGIAIDDALVQVGEAFYLRKSLDILCELAEALHEKEFEIVRLPEQNEEKWGHIIAGWIGPCRVMLTRRDQAHGEHRGSIPLEVSYTPLA